MGRVSSEQKKRDFLKSLGFVPMTMAAAHEIVLLRYLRITDLELAKSKDIETLKELVIAKLLNAREIMQQITEGDIQDVKDGKPIVKYDSVAEDDE